MIRGTRVATPPVRGEVIETETTCEPFGWSGLVLVTLKGLAGYWETRLLTHPVAVAPVELSGGQVDAAVEHDAGLDGR